MSVVTCGFILGNLLEAFLHTYDGIYEYKRNKRNNTPVSLKKCIKKSVIAQFIIGTVGIIIIFGKMYAFITGFPAIGIQIAYIVLSVIINDELM